MVSNIFTKTLLMLKVYSYYKVSLKNECNKIAESCILPVGELLKIYMPPIMGPKKFSFVLLQSVAIFRTSKVKRQKT